MWVSRWLVPQHEKKAGNVNYIPWTGCSRYISCPAKRKEKGEDVWQNGFILLKKATLT